MIESVCAWLKRMVRVETHRASACWVADHDDSVGDQRGKRGADGGGETDDGPEEALGALLACGGVVEARFEADGDAGEAIGLAEGGGAVAALKAAWMRRRLASLREAAPVKVVTVVTFETSQLLSGWLKDDAM